LTGTLYLVATPIGNLEDITYRAVRILREVDRIACEDTRQTRKLLNHYAIDRPLEAIHEHNERERCAQLVDRIVAGENVALVSDAGTPLISDPGYRLVREAITRQVPVVAIPGPSAVMTALAASGLATDEFLFAGFLPPKSGARRNELARHQGEQRTLIYFEAPHRVLETLSDIAETLPGRPVVAARELTKLHEEVLRGTPAEIRAVLAARPAVLGEFTLLVGKTEGIAAKPTDEALLEAVAQRIAAGDSRMDAIKAVARQYGLPKGDVYRIAG
jgi:16S rRNA (cytidine1402-2'-O)-methyltransferase